MTERRRGQRREDILQAFATMLEANPGGRITTAALAKQVGVSEAALYRHFPSKAKTFEGLIEFLEDSIFTRVRRILDETSGAQERCRRIVGLLLIFTERNPGFARLLTGDILAGETARLRARIRQFHDRLETQLRQVLREARARGEAVTEDVDSAANLLLSVSEGRIAQFARSDFRNSPAEGWERQWALLEVSIFPAAVLADAAYGERVGQAP